MLYCRDMTDISKFTSLLEAEKARLEASLQSVGQRNPSNPSDWEARPTETGTEADVIDEAQQLETNENNEAVLADLEIRYNEVVDALKRIENNSYGVCGVCGEAIEADRLDADPAANTCKAHLQ